MIEDRVLSDHFRLYDFLRTSHAEFQEMNMNVTPEQIVKLAKVALLWEDVRNILGFPIIISSGYRCPALNKAVGSSERSQHLLCEAADGVPQGLTVLDAFKQLRAAAKAKKFQFGQLIYEKANRGYSGGTVEWIHASLEVPYRIPERCGQILTMVDGHYVLLETVSG